MPIIKYSHLFQLSQDFASIVSSFKTSLKKNKNNTMLVLKYDQTYGTKLNYFNEHRYYFDKFLQLYWPLRPSYRYPHFWPYDLLDMWPTEHHLRKIRVRNNLYGL